jgi:hypothetical protein
MTICEFCFITDKRKRRVLKLLPNNKLGVEIGIKITRAMLYKNDFILTLPELILLASVVRSPCSDQILQEEIAKEEKWLQHIGLPSDCT